MKKNTISNAGYIHCSRHRRKKYSQSHTDSIHKELESKVILFFLSATHNQQGSSVKINIKKNFHVTKQLSLPSTAAERFNTFSLVLGPTLCLVFFFGLASPVTYPEDDEQILVKNFNNIYK